MHIIKELKQFKIRIKVKFWLVTTLVLSFKCLVCLHAFTVSAGGLFQSLIVHGKNDILWASILDLGIWYDL